MKVAAMTILTKSDVLRMLEVRVKDAGTKSEAARRFNVSPAYLGDVMNGNRAPGPKILRALGLELVCVYQRSDRAEDFTDVQPDAGK